MSLLARKRLLAAISLASIVAAFLAPRIAQDPQYHQFADQQGYLSIPNALNVLSNGLFVWAGAEGLYRLGVQKSLCILERIYPVYLVFFTALILVALGSGYYHWSPDNHSLAWDRLAMTIAFVSFFTILLGERVSLTLAINLFPPLILAGIASIVYWHYSELAGQGDLRPYGLFQYLPMLLAPLILLLFASRYTRNSDFWWLLACYLLAKIFELLDQQIYDSLAIVSGHSLKHVTASIGALVLLRHLRFRREIPA